MTNAGRTLAATIALALCLTGCNQRPSFGVRLHNMLHHQATAEDIACLHCFAAADQALPPYTPGRVVFMGDSITQQWLVEGARFFFPGKPYIARGIPGQATAGMLLRFRQDVVGLHPEAVVILGGANDILGNGGFVTQTEIEDNLAAMAEIAQANGIKVILASELPMGPKWERNGLRPTPEIQAVNHWMAAYCAQRGFIYLDFYTAMADSKGNMRSGLSGDDLHPWADGYIIMERLTQAAIDRALAKPTAQKPPQ